ncbi:MAG: hypothetical protein ACTJHC_06090 [Vagococcus sp.]
MKQNRLISIWGDTVGFMDLILSISLSIILTMGGYFIANSQNQTQQLFFGLSGAVLGFILNSFLIKPKRTLIELIDTRGDHKNG